MDADCVGATGVHAKLLFPSLFVAMAGARAEDRLVLDDRAPRVAGAPEALARDQPVEQRSATLAMDGRLLPGVPPVKVVRRYSG